MSSRNAVYLCSYNGIELLKAAIASVLAQDVDGGVDLFLVINGGTDGTTEWVAEQDFEGSVSIISENVSPCKLANMHLGEIFGMGYDHVLTLPNDVVLPSNLYAEMLRWPRGAVTASMTEDEDFPRVASAVAVNECTPMAVILWRRWAYDALLAKDGYLFDEKFWMYASDCDLALRMSACGIRGVQLDIPYYHFRSASLRMASPEEAQEMQAQADRDRAYFIEKWGWDVTHHNYGQAAMDINFLGDPSK